MDSTRPSLEALLRRLLVVTGTAAIASAIAAGCGAKVVVDLDGGFAGLGGAGGATGGAGAAGPDGGVCKPSSGSVGPGQTQITECFATPAGGCPNQYDAVLHIVPSPPCVYLVSVNCGPVVTSDECCYVITVEQKTCAPG